MTPSEAKVLATEMRQMVAAEAAHVISTEATYVASTEATHMASAKAAHVTAATSAAAGLCACGKQAAGKHGARQNHHHSSSHDILLCIGRTFRHRSYEAPRLSAIEERRRDALEMAMLAGGLH
jgi:hypothetical protein